MNGIYGTNTINGTKSRWAEMGRKWDKPWMVFQSLTLPCRQPSRVRDGSVKTVITISKLNMIYICMAIICICISLI
jgi:hypothetical protein